MVEHIHVLVGAFPGYAVTIVVTVSLSNPFYHNCLSPSSYWTFLRKLKLKKTDLHWLGKCSKQKLLREHVLHTRTMIDKYKRATIFTTALFTHSILGSLFTMTNNRKQKNNA